MLAALKEAFRCATLLQFEMERFFDRSLASQDVLNIEYYGRMRSFSLYLKGCVEGAEKKKREKTPAQMEAFWNLCHAKRMQNIEIKKCK